LLEDGRIVAVGTHHHLLETEPRYRAVLSEEVAHDDDDRDDEAEEVLA
jgi:hypothetical protein